MATYVWHLPHVKPAAPAEAARAAPPPGSGDAAGRSPRSPASHPQTHCRDQHAHHESAVRAIIGLYRGIHAHEPPGHMCCVGHTSAGWQLPRKHASAAAHPLVVAAGPAMAVTCATPSNFWRSLADSTASGSAATASRIHCSPCCCITCGGPASGLTSNSWQQYSVQTGRVQRTRVTTPQGSVGLTRCR